MRVLLVGGQGGVYDLAHHVGRWGHDVRTAPAPAEAGPMIEEWEPGAVIFGLGRAPGDGFDLLQRATGRKPGPGMIALVEEEGVEAAVRAMEEGASDVLTRPVELPRLKRRLEVLSGLRSAGATDPIRDLEGLPAEDVIGRSEPMRRLLAVMRRVAPSSASVLLTGESGSGKDFIAQALHAMSGRSTSPFVAVSCPAIPESLLESELFGHQRGAFTGAIMDRPGLFERALGGSIFLDEITEMATGLQAKLLRVLDSRRFRRLGGAEEKAADFRVFAATNREPEAAVSQGLLREDLYYRLNVFHLAVPPLRERREDIASFAARFAALYAAQNGRDLRGLSAEALAALERHDWPGNVRELRNVIERAVVLSRNSRIGLADLPERLRRAARPPFPSNGQGIETLEEVERRAILAAIERFKGNKSQAARVLGISLKTLRAKLRHYEARAAAEGLA